ncbi:MULTISPECIES: urea ABC transporter permease subunit UrtC [Streptomyces]|uniref:Urea transport system permease protein n=1 Tax=Streptomyces stelliscabiei TaxID=146820 RepID=A0A8I0TR52_9ACTN|nr:MULTISPECIES: urea ABC transporter permease subunit UrtC [Streptomyces]KND26662.1 urea ABC transporter permease [Streptomyces stelliscabiei]MBE1594908.1 urea transport system permease protein [Streptomyces stelliscabiei]MDX2520747.1 urea ABC transporter permease subunit UrtC [Streptomyces stelliscabiei]MDX2551037.1 urea ABC transporter permease subunit UrtC [Streptomyces stelliscabiei]MDX2614824.1 urea ABC transporter permease subunit UrtC [Streptomyces stelliscabiei]
MTTTTPSPEKTAPVPEPSPSLLDRFRVPGAFLLGAALLLGVAPLALSDFRLNLLAKYLCYAIVAVGVSLAWGRGGLLVLGQGVFFGLGGYAMAMHLKLADAADAGQTLPDFMQLYGTGDTLPWWWRPFAEPAFALAMTVLLPMAVAALLGFFVFRRRVKGAYFAILSQALAAALAIWLVGQQATTGGTNGLTDMRGFFGYDLDDPVNQRMVYFVIAAVLLLLMAAARQLFVSRYGELLVAVRDSEERVRFLGYDPANVKLVAYVVAAGMAGLAGALFVPAVGIISPALIGVVPSIGFVIGAAVGGRASLVGAVLGAIAVAWAQSTLSDAFPAAWTYLQGLLFVLAVGFLPGGLASLASVVRRRRTPTAGPAATTTITAPASAPTGGTA